MLTYRGDKFVKGKKFKINESTYRFQKRDDEDNLIFESLDGKELRLTEEEFNSGKKILDPTKYIESVADEMGVDLNSKTPFEYFYAMGSDAYVPDVSSDYAVFYDRVLHDMGYGENPVLNDCRAEVEEVSDGKNELKLNYNGKEMILDVKAWDNLDSVKDNVESIIELLTSK